ncbi:CPBP family intramembrane glutamic endopeptidase [Parachryseolinea silvisoli]|uniref:CPBP family intramembrane glutamic endopeptidase n=1 Tax=Parachryseolinea silvisoli TaxID=2873601 RepID=UPI002265DAFF|nr:type II CAAX endopeptidase family protein [Parachryseolinea silvisoli]MCD9016084.1 CPBP family intramembrane metalloprotease [Parachryseolinea silvisoli]
MEPEIARRQSSPLTTILLMLVAVLLGFQIVGPLIGYFIALPFYPGSGTEMIKDLKNPIGHPEVKVPLFIMQGCATFFGLILIPVILIHILRSRAYAVGFFNGAIFPQTALITVALVFVFTGVNSIFIEWNQNIKFPDGIEQPLKDLEEMLRKQTEFLTKFDSIGQLILAVVVVSILPGIGEELVFRGIIQREFYRATRNIHVSIWVSAAIFSAIHIQFYGFVPRMLLGALFGYLYYWSGSLTMSMLAHLFNNGMMVVALYFYQQGALDIDVESTEAAPWPIVAISTAATGLLGFLFWKFYRERGLGQARPEDDATTSL